MKNFLRSLNDFPGERSSFDSRSFTETTFLNWIKTENIVRDPQVAFSNHFLATADSFLYAKLIRRISMHSSFPKIGRVMDLGAGSGLPSLLGLYPLLKAQVISLELLDVDPKALLVCKENISSLGLNSGVSVRQTNLFSSLSSNDYKMTNVVFSNPPYLPTKGGEGQGPVDGGPRGTLYLDAILKRDWRSGTVVGLAFSSLSNPDSIFESIEGRYEVLFLDAYECPLGRYTGLPENLSYYLELHKKKLAYFSHIDGERSRFWTLGLALRKA